jgi:hypothetical protein
MHEADGQSLRQQLEVNMDHLSKSDLRSLLEHDGQPHLSLYMPTHRAGAEIQQNPIRFRNLLGQAEDRLSDYGLRGPEVQEFLEPARNQLGRDEAFWQQNVGLALFMAPNLLQYYRLPVHFEETLMLGNQFYFKPIFKVFQNRGQFYILALSQNEVRLLEGTKYGVEEVKLERLPASLTQALKWDNPERQTQGHTVSGGQQGGDRGRPDITFHGHGVGKDDEKTDILRYFREVNKGLSEFLADKQDPLLLAGVEYLFPIYQDANSYRYLADQGIEGNPEDLSAETLHTRAWELLVPRFKTEQQEAFELYRQQFGNQTGRASKNIQEIVPAAYGGRVGRLFLREQSEIWGHYDRADNRVDVHPKRMRDSEDLLNTAAVYAFQNDAAIYIVDDNEMPDKTPIAAVFRY